MYRRNGCLFRCGDDGGDTMCQFTHPRRMYLCIINTRHYPQLLVIRTQGGGNRENQVSRKMAGACCSLLLRQAATCVTASKENQWKIAMTVIFGTSNKPLEPRGIMVYVTSTHLSWLTRKTKRGTSRTYCITISVLIAAARASLGRFYPQCYLRYLPIEERQKMSRLQVYPLLK